MAHHTSPIYTEGGAGIYRQAHTAVRITLRTVRKWRNAIEDAIAKQTVDQLDLSQAVEELRREDQNLDAWLAPYVVDGKIIDQHDERNRELLAKLDVDDRVILAGEFAKTRDDGYEALEFPCRSAFEVVSRLGDATLDAFETLLACKGLKSAIEHCVRPESPLRTERRGLGAISRLEAERLERACLWEAEQAWGKVAPPAPDDNSQDMNGKQIIPGDDFRSVRCGGTSYHFTANQAPVVKLLYEHWLRGTPDVGDETLLNAVDPEAPPKRIGGLFRNCPAWGTIIVRGKTKGTHRLVDPR